MNPTQTDKAIKDERVPKTTNRLAGNTLWRFKKPSPKQYKSFFLAPLVDPVTGKKSGTRGNRKTALAEIISAELGFDATMEAYKDPNVRKKFALIQEVQGYEKMENDVAEIAKSIEREQDRNFSITLAKEKGDKGKKLRKIFWDRLKPFAKVLLTGATVKEAYEQVYGNEIYTGKKKEKFIGELERYLAFFPSVEKTIGKKITKEEFLKIVTHPNEMESFNMIFGAKPMKRDLSTILKMRNAWGKVAKALGYALAERFLVGNVLGRASKIFATDYYGNGLKEVLPGRTEKKLLEEIAALEVLKAEIKGVTTEKQKIAKQKSIDSKKKKIAELEEKIATNNLGGSPRSGVFSSVGDAAVVLEGLSKQNKIVLSDHPQNSGPYQSVYNTEGINGLRKEANNWKKSALENQNFLIIFAKTIKNMLRDGDLSPEEASMIYGQLLNIGMSSPISAAAIVTNVPTDINVSKTQVLVYEHSIPRRDVAIHLAAFTMGMITESELKALLSNYEVSLITEEMDTLLKQEGLVSSRKPLSKFNTPGADRYNIPGWSLPLTNIFTGQPEPITTNAANRNFSKTASKDSIIAKAIIASRAIRKRKGISVWDFDDTLAKSKSNVLFTSPDGKKGKLNAEEFAKEGANLLREGYTFDFSEFSKVVKGEKGPFFQKFVDRIKKFGIKDNFILTARPVDSNIAIQAFLKSQGLNIPLKNITGLANSTSEAKALWIAEKVGEGYNDFYFADDHLENVQAVDNMLEQFDVKRDVQQAKRQFSETMSDDFNSILEEVIGVLAGKKFGKQAAKLAGKVFSWKRFGLFASSAQDFKGLLYNFIGKGKLGEKHWEFFKKHLIDPFNRGIDELNRSRQAIANDYKLLLKKFPGIKKKLRQKVGDTAFTVDHAVRVYIWTSLGLEIPGLSQSEINELVSYVENDPVLKVFAEGLKQISKQEDGYVKPGDHWTAETIASDLLSDGALGDARSKFLAEFIQNVDIIFSEENLNKIEAMYGSNFREALEDIIYRMKTGSNRPTGKNRLVNQFMNWTNNSVGAIMFFNMRSALLQTISMFNYINWADNNPLKAAQAFANQKQFWKDFVMIFNSDFLQQRRTGARRTVNEAELAAAVMGSDNKVKAAIAWLLEKGFLPTQIADSFAIASGGAIFFRNRVNALMKEGMSREEAEKQAFLDFQTKTEEAQQSSRPDMISQQQASPLGRLILAFANTPMQYMRLMNKAARDLYNRRGDDKSNVSKIIYYGFVQAALFTILQQALTGLFGDDEEEEDQRRLIDGMLDSHLVGFGFGGRAISTMKRTISEYNEQKDKGWQADHAYTLLSLLSFSPPIGSKARKIYSAIQTEKYQGDIMKERGFTLDNPAWGAVGNVIEGFTNIPLGRLARKAYNVDNAFDSTHEWWQRAALFMGWNTWDLGIKDPDLEELKAGFKKSGKKKGDGNITNDTSTPSSGRQRCNGTNSEGNQCGMYTKSSSGYCHYHD